MSTEIRSLPGQRSTGRFYRGRRRLPKERPLGRRHDRPAAFQEFVERLDGEAGLESTGGRRQRRLQPKGRFGRKGGSAGHGFQPGQFVELGACAGAMLADEVRMDSAAELAKRVERLEV